MSDIAKLVADAPPGEVDAVRKDIEEFCGNSSAVKRAVVSALEDANVATPRIVEVDGESTVLSKFNQLGPSTFFSHGSRPKKFEVDHVSRKTTSEGTYEPHRSTRELQKEVDAYVEQHYPSVHIAAVFALEKAGEFAVVIIGRKLSPENFFNGQLTAQYNVDSDSVRGTIHADVHYFEEGNVRLKSSTKVDTPVKTTVAAAIEKVESDFERSLNKTLVGLNEREFKALRRQLPVTRQPMMWGKAIAGYKLGKELERE